MRLASVSTLSFYYIYELVCTCEDKQESWERYFLEGVYKYKIMPTLYTQCLKYTTSIFYII